jgi:hypothetical protein
MRRRIALVVATLILVIVVPFHLLAIFIGGAWDWAAGVSVGAVVTLFMAARESPPEHIERLRTGAEGEKQTGKALKRLSSPWTSFHDLDRGPGLGNIDHVVVGPGGVFLLDSKFFVGETAVENDVVRVIRYEDPELAYVAERLPQRMRAASRQVHDDLRRKTRASVWVQPVVVLWGGFSPGVLEEHGVVYLHGSRLAAWLQERPVRLADDHIQRVASVIPGLSVATVEPTK